MWDISSWDIIHNMRCVGQNIINTTNSYTTHENETMSKYPRRISIHLHEREMTILTDTHLPKPFSHTTLDSHQNLHIQYIAYTQHPISTNNR